MHLVDTHCHLDVYHQKGILDLYLSKARLHQVKQLISVGTQPGDWGVHQAIHQAYGQEILYTVGLHPSYVSLDTITSIESLGSFSESSLPPQALGECGLDYYRLDPDPETLKLEKALQHKAFSLQLALAKQYACPLIVHCRKAFKDCLHLLDESRIPPSQVIFHCFSEGKDELEALLKKGYRASFTGIITYKNAEAIRQAALLQGLDKLILETDAPWLAPVPKRGETNEPAYLLYTADYAAKLFDVSLETLMAATTHNAQNFFQLPNLS